MDLVLDINSELYSVKQDEELTFVLARWLNGMKMEYKMCGSNLTWTHKLFKIQPFSTLSLDGVPDDGTYKPIDEEATLADRYDYVMHGRVFQYKWALEILKCSKYFTL